MMMKIKIKKTDEIVDAIKSPTGFGLDDAPYLRADGKGRYSENDIEVISDDEQESMSYNPLDDQPFDIDIWEERRYEIAKTILPTSSFDEFGALLDPKVSASIALKRADALIAALKKEG